jgi:predicted phosphodiesterase
MTTIRYISDIHLEFQDYNNIDNLLDSILPDNKAICVLAGDIGNPYLPNYDIFMSYISKSFKHAFVIAGNHEYYNRKYTIEEINDYLKKYFMKFDNISFLNNSYEYYDNYCFIGTTLWSKVTDFCTEANDVYKIRDFDYYDYNNLNKQCINFLSNVLYNNDNCIVITHHLPSYSLIDDRYKKLSIDKFNQWFYCDLDNLIKENNNKIKCWFYGHTHTSSNIMLHNVNFVCNPIGYPNENNIESIDYNRNIQIN